MKRIFAAVIIVLTLVCLFGGCARTYWADRTYIPRTNANVNTSPNGNNMYGYNDTYRNYAYGNNGVNRNNNNANFNTYGNNRANRSSPYGNNGINGNNNGTDRNIYGNKYLNPNYPMATDNMGTNRNGRNVT